MAEDGKFYGKYRGVVKANNDPKNLGRIQAIVPDVFGEKESGWAMPCFPFGGVSMGFVAVPDVNTGVWIEFECGDPEYPIWSGCWWGDKGQMPKDGQSKLNQKVLIVTKGGHSIFLDDKPGSGGITLKTSGGQKLEMTPNGIVIDNGKGATIEMTNNKISINKGALEVM